MRAWCCGWLVAAMVLASGTVVRSADKKADEPGFKPFFNGKDLTGWKMQKGGASLDGKTEVNKKRFQVADGKLIIDWKTKGNLIIETARTFDGDMHIKFEFMAGPKCNNDLYIRGNKFDIKSGKGGVANLKEGAWQTFEIIVTGKKIEFKCDGETQRTSTVKPGATPLGVRAEFGEVQFRNMRAK